MKNLEQYYKDEVWVEYSNLYGKSWTNSDYQIKLLEKCNQELEIAKVIFHHLKENSLEWMDSKVPALDNLTPMQCIYDEKLINRLRICLLRFPQ